MTGIELISLISSLVSLILAIVAIVYAYISSKESNNNFQKTQQYMNDSYERTKDVLAEIDKRAAVIDKTVTDSQQQLMSTVTNILNETVIPKKVDVGEQLGMQLLQQLIQNPEGSGKMMAALKPIMDMSNKNKTENN